MNRVWVMVHGIVWGMVVGVVQGMVWTGFMQ